MSRSKTVVKSVKSVGSKLEELINVKPINVATKKDVQRVNYLIRKNLMTTDEVVKEAIVTNNPTIMWMVAKFVNGITDAQKTILNLAINNSSEKLMYREVKKKVITCGPSLSLREIKLAEKREKINAIVQKYANKDLGELIQFSPITMHASKRNVRAVNYLIHKGLKTVDSVVDEAIKSKNPLVMYYVALFVDGITDYHLGMIVKELDKCKKSLDVRVDVVMHNLAKMRPSIVPTLSKKIVNTDCVSGMVSFANNIENASITYIGNSLLKKAKTEDDAKYIYYFVRNHLKDLTKNYIKKATKKVMELKNPYVIYSFVQFGGAPILEFALALIEAVNNKSFNAVYLYLFFSDYGLCEDFPESDIIMALLRTQNYEYIFRSARDLMISPVLMAKIVKKISKRAKRDLKNNTCRDYLVKLALCDNLSSYYAVDEIISIGDPILITYVLQNCKNEELAIVLQEGLNSIIFEGESLNDNGVMEMPLIRKKDEDSGKSIVVES